MLAEPHLRTAFETMLGEIVAPPVPMAEIQRRIVRPPPARRPRLTLVRAAIATAAVVAVAVLLFPSATLALARTLMVDGYRAAYRVMGWTPPPPPPARLESSVSSQRATLATARSRVTFSLVLPAGLPADVTTSTITTTPTLVYSNLTRSWSKGSPFVTFTYRRIGGRTFSIRVEPYDPRTGPPPKFMYLADDLPGGRVALTKRENFAWRNGNQMASATQGDGITAAEIQSIRAAMHGIPIASAVNERPKSGTVEKQYRIP